MDIFPKTFYNRRPFLTIRLSLHSKFILNSVYVLILNEFLFRQPLYQFAMSKEAEIAACIAEAEKQLKTSFLKWQPNFELAADRYQRAAQLLRGQHERQRDALLKVINSTMNHFPCTSETQTKKIY